MNTKELLLPFWVLTGVPDDREPATDNGLAIVDIFNIYTRDKTFNDNNLTLPRGVQLFNFSIDLVEIVIDYFLTQLSRLLFEIEFTIIEYAHNVQRKYIYLGFRSLCNRQWNAYI